MSPALITLDVRDDLRQGREPFAKIMKAAGELGPSGQLLLLAPFEPAPLYFVLERQGFAHQSKRLQSGDWEVSFTRSAPAAAEPPPPERPPCRIVGAAPAEIIEVDARGLEPPQPMVKILEALAELPAGAELRAHTERRPMHLYAQLEERGFNAQTEQQSDGSHITHIRRS